MKTARYCRYRHCRNAAPGETHVKDAQCNVQPWPCIQCGVDIGQQADASADDETFTFRCPRCGRVDHI